MARKYICDSASVRRGENDIMNRSLYHDSALNRRLHRAVCLLVFCCVGALCNEVSAARPNIVFIFSDDHALRALGAYGSGLNQTPHIDRLANRGMTFTDGHSSSGICTPSRYAMLTGQHHWRRFHDIVGVILPDRGQLFSTAYNHSTVM